MYVNITTVLFFGQKKKDPVFLRSFRAKSSVTYYFIIFRITYVSNKKMHIIVLLKSNTQWLHRSDLELFMLHVFLKEESKEKSERSVRGRSNTICTRNCKQGIKIYVLFSFTCTFYYGDGSLM